MGNALFCGCISSSSIGVIERFGKFHKIAEPGLFFKVPLIDQIRSNVSTRKNQIKIEVDTKISDNVFCKVIVAVIYSVKMEQIYQTVYGYGDFQGLVNSYVQNEIRSELSMNYVANASH